MSGKAEETAEEAADGGETAGELCVVRRVGVLDAGVDDGADTGTDADAYDGSDDHGPGRVAGSDELDLILWKRDGAIDTGLSVVADEAVFVS